MIKSKTDEEVKEIIETGHIIQKALKGKDMEIGLTVITSVLMCLLQQCSKDCRYKIVLNIINTLSENNFEQETPNDNA